MDGLGRTPGQLPIRHKPGSLWRLGAWGRRGLPNARLDIECRPGKAMRATDRGAISLARLPDVDFVFDELVVDSWLHVEQMDDRIWWLRVGDADITVHIGERGEASSVHIRRGDHGEVKGATEL